MIVRLLRILALVLLAWQAVLARAHQHEPTWAHAPAGQLAALSAPVTPATDVAPDCLLCRQATRDDASLPPGELGCAAPVQVNVRPATTRAIGPATSQDIRHWRSRAPPGRDDT